MTVASRAPAFSDTAKAYAAMEMVAALYFGPTSDLYKRLVVEEQKVDTLFADNPGNMDPELFTVAARVKKAEDAPYVRDEILRTMAAARTGLVPSRVLQDAKSNAKYSFSRTLDSTERIAAVVASYAAFHRSFQTVNNLYRVLDSLTPADLAAVARTCFTDAGLVVTTLSSEALPAAVATLPSLSGITPAKPFAGQAGAARPPAAAPGHTPSRAASGRRRRNPCYRAEDAAAAARHQDPVPGGIGRRPARQGRAGRAGGLDDCRRRLEGDDD